MTEDHAPTAPARTTEIPVREPMPGPHASGVNETEGDVPLAARAQAAPGSENASDETPQAPGLLPGGGVDPGDTPPAGDQLSGAAGDAVHAPNMGPVSGNRTPMIVTLVLLGVAVIAIAIITAASFLPS